MSNNNKCGIDLVCISRVKDLVINSNSDALGKIFSQYELDYAGQAMTRFGRLAARFAAKEACLKLFPVETAIGLIDLSDFSVQNDSYGAPIIICSQRAIALIDLYGFQEISVSLSHTKEHAIAMVFTSSKDFKAPIIGRLIYWLLPFKRGLLLAKLESVYAKTLNKSRIKSMAQAHCASLIKSDIDLFLFLILSQGNQIAETFRNVVTPWRAFRRPASTVASVPDRDH